MTTQATIGLIVMIYLALKLVLGYVYKRFSSEGLDNFAVGGRKITWPWLALALASTNVAGAALLGISGLAWTLGISSGWYFIAIALGQLVYAFFIASPFRRSGAITAPEWYEQRFDLKNRVLISILNFLAAITYVTLQLTAAVIAVHTILGYPTFYATLLVGGVFIIYTYLGGFMSVMITDVVSYLIMIAGLILTVWHAAEKFSFHALTTLPATPYHDWKAIGFVAILSYSLNAISWGVDQISVSKSAAAVDETHAKKAGIAAAAWSLLIIIFVPLIGMFGKIAYPDLKSANSIFPLMIQNFLPPVVAGIALAAILSATMSAASGNLLAFSNVWSKDIYQRLINPKATQKQLVKSSRSSIIVVGVIAIIASYYWGQLPPSLVSILLLAASLTVSYFVSMIVGLYTSRLTAATSFYSMLFGSIVAIGYTILSLTTGLTVWAGAVLPTFLSSGLVVLIGILFTKGSVDRNVNSLEAPASAQAGE